MPEALDSSKAELARLRDRQDELDRNQVKLTVTLEALLERIERDGQVHAKAMEEIFRRLGTAETGVEVGRTRWALAGAAVLVVCSMVTSFVTLIVGKLWP